MGAETRRAERDPRLCYGGREHSPVSTIDEHWNSRSMCIVCNKFLDAQPGTGYAEDDDSHYFNDDGY